MVRAFTGVLGLDPKTIFDSVSPYGEMIAWLIVFAETGLLIGFFLPGDSLLFTAGILAGQSKLELWLLLPGAFVAAVAGDQLGYSIGHRIGPALFRRPDSRFFKQVYVQRTHAFFEQHGSKAVVLARFVPVVRTFTPVLAGVGRMSRRVYTIYNVLGGFMWAVGITLLGFALGNTLGSGIDSYLLPIIAAIVVISLVPPFIEWRRARTRKAPVPADGDPKSPVGSDERG